MINFFSNPGVTDDKSLVYLYSIFGSMNGIITNPEGLPSNNSAITITLLGTMFQKFNSIILIIAALMVVYVTIVGVIMTAHEGEFMGKKWNNIWIPIRTVLGIAALVPTSSGYSGLQIIMMWCILQGIGAANQMWGAVIGYNAVFGPPNAQSVVPTVNVQNALQGVFQALVCQASLGQNYANPNGSSNIGNYYCNVNGCSPSSSPPSLSTDTTVTTLNFGLNGNSDCGTLTYCNESTSCPNGDNTSLACSVCQAQKTQLNNILTTMYTIANNFVQIDYEYRQFYPQFVAYQVQTRVLTVLRDLGVPVNMPSAPSSIPQSVNTYCSQNSSGGSGSSSSSGSSALINCNLPSSIGGPDNYDEDPTSDAVTKIYAPQMASSNNFLNTLVGQYVGGITTAIGNYMNTLVNQNSSSLPQPLQQALSTGWMLAGSYYYVIGEANNINQSASIPTISYTISQQPDLSGSSYTNYRTNYTAAGQLVQALSGGGGGSFGNNPSLSQVGGVMSGTMGSVSAAFSNAVNNPVNTNPLLQVQASGYALLLIGTISYVIFMVVTLVLGFTGNIDVFILGTGVVDPVGPAMTLVYFLLVPAILGLIGLMITLGATLGVYTPLIPYTIFTFGAIGWLTSCVEAMVAGPLVALGILSPSGQHEIMGKAEPAIMLLFNIMIRPTLMIFGMVAAMLLSAAAVAMINAGFSTAMNGIAAMGSSSAAAGIAALAANPVELIFFLVAYVFFIVAALNKCFAAISIIPERVMRWISGQGEQYGESEAVGELKRAGEGAGAGVKGAADKGHSQTEAGFKQSGTARDAKADRNAKSGGTVNKAP